MKIVFNSSKSELKKNAQEHLVKSLRSDLPDLLLFAGGSATEIPEGLDLMGVPSMVFDERFSRDLKFNNSMLLANKGVDVIELVPQKGEDLFEFSNRFESILNSIAKKNTKVLAVIGVGVDGHIGGINPMDDAIAFDEEFNNPQKWVVGYESSLMPPERVTVTIPFLLKKVDSVLVYLVGKTKQAVVKELIHPTKEIYEFPAQVLNQHKNVTLFTDQMV